MAIWTYVENSDPKSKVKGIELEGGLILYIQTYANLTAKQLEQIYSSGAGIVLKEGIVPPATSATGGTQISGTKVRVWSSKTYFLENELIISPEGELLRVLKNFESGESYVF